MTQADELFQLFEQEAKDHLQKSTNALIELEQQPTNTEYLNLIKREIHTLKGAARMMGFKNISQVAHQIENLFESLENQEFTLTKSMITTTLQWLDWITESLEKLPQENPLPENFDTLFQNMINGLVAPIGNQKNVEKQTPSQEQPQPTPQYPQPTPSKQPQEKIPKHEKVDYLTLRFDRIKLLLNYSNIFTSYLGRFRYYGEQMNIEQLAKLSKDEILDHIEKWQSQFLYDVRFYELYTKQFQDQVSSMILVPLASVFNNMPRLVRDVAVATGKEVNLLIEGKEIEIDKQLIDHIQNVLIHLLRNAVDHGIEPPEERKQKGKSPIGTINLKAYTQMDRVVIEVADDGQGIRTDTVLQKAIQKKLISPDHARELSRQEILQLIFLPGFSTKDSVNDFSGRGVGLDVVAETMRRFNSEIFIETEENKGTKFILSFPINSSIISITLFEGNNDLYALPSLNIDQVLLAHEQRISLFEEETMLEYKHQWIPLISIEELLGFPPLNNTKENIIVLAIQNRYYGILVERVLGEQSVVIKSLSGLNEKIRIISGILSLSRRDVLVLNSIELIELYRHRVSRRSFTPTEG